MRLVISWLLIFCCSPVYAQIGNYDIFGDEGLVSEPTIQVKVKKHTIIENRVVGKIAGRQPDTLVLPFYDDFSYEGVWPDSTKWYDFQSVYRSNGLAICPPSSGTVIFDGTAFNGKPYSDEINFGPSGATDILVSQPIDLSGYRIADSLYLRFWYQCGGRADIPEADDSLIVWFTRADTIDSIALLQWQWVWRTGGDSLADRFTPVLIPLNDSAFFTKAFQFRFTTIGSQSGFYDCWHIDQVSLDTGRRISDIIAGQRSMAEITPLRLQTTNCSHSYTAMARKQFSNLVAARFLPLSVTVSNQDTIRADGTVDISLTEKLTNRPLAGIGPLSSSVNFSGFGCRNLQPGTFSTIPTGIDTFWKLSTMATLNIPLENRSAADTVSTDFRIDSVLAVDDGEAEAGYGLRSNRAFGQEYCLSAADTLRAVWISFVPVFQSFNGKSFLLRVWLTPQIDSGYKQFAGVFFSRYDSVLGDYGATELNYFHRYVLDSPIAIPANQPFWVGIQQSDDRIIGVGFDKSYDNRPRFFRDSLGNWRPSQLAGTLMIRPELSSFTFNPPLAAAKELSAGSFWQWIHDNHDCSILKFQSKSNGIMASQPLVIALFNVNGICLKKQYYYINSDTIEMRVDDLPAGVYWVEIQETGALAQILKVIKYSH